MICVNMLWLHKTGRFSFGYFLVPGVSWRENCKSKHSRKLQLWVKSHSLCHKPLREWLLTQGAEGIIQKTRHEGLNADLGLRKSIFKMGSDFWKELDPRGDAQIPGGEDGNDFFFFLTVGSCYWWKNWPAGTEFLLCVTDHLPRPDSFWILRVQNPNAGRPRLNLSLVHCPTSSISQIKILKLNSSGTEIMPFWRTKKKIMRHLQTFSIN